MGFFSDLKEDLSQAVNELLPGETASPEETLEGISLEEMLQNIDAVDVSRESEEEGAQEEEYSSEEQAPLEEETAEAEENDKDYLDLERELMEAFGDAGADSSKALPETDDGLTQMTSDGDSWDSEEVTMKETEEEMTFPEIQAEEKGEKGKMDSYASRVATEETSVITEGMKITGDIESAGSVDIIGSIVGNITVLGKLNVTGSIEGNSKAAEVYAEGAQINGEVVSEGAVKIGASSVIIGNITATSAAIAGAVKGDIDVKGPVVLDASAIVMGNIKSKSVQINNGAVIEGMCSQCYADVNPTSFFDDYKKNK